MSNPDTKDELDELILEFETATRAYALDGGTNLESRAENRSELKAKLLERERVAREELIKLVESVGEEVVGAWEKHAYSLDSMVNDTLIYQKHPNADKRRREQDATDRRAILLTRGFINTLRERLAQLQGGDK